MARFGSTRTRSRFASASADQPSKNVSVDTIDELKSVANTLGVQVREKKPSLFSRVVDVISRPLYASAGAAKAIVKNVRGTGHENIAQEALKGIRGQEKETYADVLGEAGVQNKYVRGAVGFALDVALDPSTYFGGKMVQVGGRVLRTVAEPASKISEKLAPGVARGLGMAGGSLKDAVGRAFVFGYGATKGLSDDVARTLNRLGIAKEEVLQANAKRFAGYSKKELDEAGELMIQNRRLELAARKGSKTKYLSSDNKRVNELLRVMKSKAKEMAKAAGLDPEKSYEHYIPFLRLDKLGKGVEQSTSALKVGREGYRKEFQDLIKDENLLKKPVEAYSRREYEVVRDGLVRESLDNVVAAYGKPLDAFTSLDEAQKAGYTLLKTREFGKPLGYMKAADANFITNHLFPEMKTIDHLAKASQYDNFTRWFKTAVTSWFPAFHIRNYLSGHVQNYQVVGSEAFNPANHNVALAILKGAKKQVTLGGYVYDTAALRKELAETFEGSSQYIADIGKYIEEAATNNFTLKRMKDPGRILGNFIEMNQKAVATVAGLRQGKPLAEALKLAETAGFDYSKITQFESKIMRRLIPFYTFARKNAELQVRTAAQHPERILNQIKFTQNLSEVFGGRKPTDDELSGLPPWALQGLGFKLEGDRFVTQFGLPLEEFVNRLNKPGTTALSSLNPLVKYPLESKLGYDFFRERKITDISSIAPGTAELIQQKGPDWLKDVMNIRKYVDKEGVTRYSASPKALHVLRNIPTSRVQNTLENLFDTNKDDAQKWLAFLSGVRVYDIDQELQSYFRERDLRSDIENELLRTGQGREFRTFYVPKDSILNEQK